MYAKTRRLLNEVRVAHLKVASELDKTQLKAEHEALQRVLKAVTYANKSRSPEAQLYVRAVCREYLNEHRKA